MFLLRYFAKLKTGLELINPFLQTYTGNILIAVNPFRKLPHLYDSHMMAQYKGATFGELSPHPFAVADAAYRFLSFKLSRYYF